MFHARFKGSYVTSNSMKAQYEIIDKETSEVLGNALVSSEIDEDGEFLITSDNLGADVLAAFDEAYGLEANGDFSASVDFDLPLLVVEDEPPAE